MGSGVRTGRRRGRQSVSIDVGGALDASIGAQAGVSAAELDSVAARIGESISRLEADRGEGTRPFLELAQRRGDLKRTLAAARDLAGKIDSFVIVAGEGSALGTQLLVQALVDRPEEVVDGRPAILVLDGADPAAVQAVLARVDLRRTVFHVLSRSGERVETLAVFLILRDRLLSELGAVDYTRHLLLTTDTQAGPLRQIVNDEGLHATEFPPGVAGHQAASSPQHLLGAAVAGVDTASFLAGVMAMDARCRLPDPEANPAARLATIYYLLATLHGVQTHVLFHYADRLAGFAQWWRHLWAATLAKKLEGESSRIAVGTTPVVARGTLDHSSQIQSYLEGPADKVITFLSVDGAAQAGTIPGTYGDLEDIAYLGGRSLAELGALERAAVEFAMARESRPSISISVPVLDAYALGELVRLFEVTTLLGASLHDVDPQARPASEVVRRLVLGALGRPGFESEQQAFERWRDSRRRSLLP